MGRGPVPVRGRPDGQRKIDPVRHPEPAGPSAPGILEPDRPALFRTLHDRGGTLLFDEAERLRQSTPDQQEVLSMLLAGYRRGGQATRLEPVGDSFRAVAFDVYGPKALACIGGLPPALASRCIPVMMFRAGPGSPKPRRRIDADPTRWQSVRDHLHALALEYGPTLLELSRRRDACPEGIDGRSYELWQPLLALASWLESQGEKGLLSLMKCHALETIDGARDDQIPDADETLLELLTEQIQGGRSPTPGELLKQAQERDQVTFGKWGPRTVSNRLKTYGIEARKVDRRREYRDTTLADLARIQQHYAIDLGISEAADPPPASSRCVPYRPDKRGFGLDKPTPGLNGTIRDEARGRGEQDDEPGGTTPSRRPRTEREGREERRRKDHERRYEKYGPGVDG